MRPPCHPSLCSKVANRRALGEQPGAEPSSAGFPQGLGGWEEALGFVSLGAQGWEDSWVQIYWVGPSVESHGTFKNQKLPSEMDYKFCFIIVLTSVMDLRGQWRATPPHHPPPRNVPEALPALKQSPALGCSPVHVTLGSLPVNQHTCHLLQGAFPDPPGFISQNSEVLY